MDDALALLKKKKNLRIIRYGARLPEAFDGGVARAQRALGGVLAEDGDTQAVRRKPGAWLPSACPTIASGWTATFPHGTWCGT